LVEGRFDERARRFEAEARAASTGDSTWVFRLYVSGMTVHSAQAIRAIRDICEEHFPDKYDLEVFDLYSSPERAADADVVAAPTLDKLEPQPAVRMIGSLSDRAKVLRSLGLEPTSAPADPSEDA
jgi:circadian clock protein KaiB